MINCNSIHLLDKAMADIKIYSVETSNIRRGRRPSWILSWRDIYLIQEVDDKKIDETTNLLSDFDDCAQLRIIIDFTTLSKLVQQHLLADIN